jgi:hypothetical protein
MSSAEAVDDFCQRAAGMTAEAARAARLIIH